jgi:DNA-binding transcriptional ArsR family regulator
MSPQTPPPYDALERIFHEPNRLAILSALCAADKGLTFGELKLTCELTDGNLNRHLKALSESGVVRVRKRFVDSKPRTTVYLTRMGLTRFSQYLDALREVLEQASASLGAEPRPERSAPAGTRLPA